MKKAKNKSMLSRVPKTMSRISVSKKEGLITVLALQKGLLRNRENGKHMKVSSLTELL